MVKCIVLLLVLTCAVSAEAHQVYLWAEVKGQEIQGYAYTPSGRIAGATVRVCNVAGEVLGEVVTDEQGEYSYAVKSIESYVLTLDTGDGHLAKVEIEAVELGGTDVVEGLREGELAAVDAKLSKILRELDDFKRQRRWQDIVGGVGYLVGLSGIMFYVMGKRAGEKG